MFDRLDVLLRDDTPTPRPARDTPPCDEQRREDRPRDDRPRDEQQTTGHRRDYDNRDRRTLNRDGRHDGHRRGQDPRRSTRTITDRMRGATADLGVYRAVAYRDVAEKHFDGHPYAARRAVDRLVRQGLVREHKAEGPKGGSFTVLTVTAAGARGAQRAAQEQGLDREQQTWTGLVKKSELAHDTAVFRAAKYEQDRIEQAGGRVTRVRIDAELKQIVARATEKARAESGRRAADDARRTAAQELGLPLNGDKVLYPDAQLEIEDAEGRSGRVNVEIASEHYRAAAITAKAGAGFAMHGNGGRATRNIARALGSGGGDGGGGGAAQPGRDGSVEL